MSNQIMDRIWWREDFDTLLAPISEELPGSGRSLKWVLIALADNASDEGFCWPSVGTIAQKTSLTPRSVQRAIKQAIRLGILRRRLRTNKTSQYLFNLDVLPQGKPGKTKRGSDPFGDIETEPDLFETAKEPFEPDPDEDFEGVTSVHSRGDIYAVGVTSVHSRGDRVSPKPSVEPPIEPSGEPSVAETALVVASDPKSISDFVKMEWDKLHERHPELPGIRVITESMKNLIRQRAKEHAQPGESAHDVWREVLAEIDKSKFLQGRAPPGPGRTTRFRLTLSTLLKPHIFREVINGKYADSAADQCRVDPSTGEILTPAATATRGTIERLRAARKRNSG